MHVIIHLRKFYRPVCFPRNWKLRHIKQPAEKCSYRSKKRLIYLKQNEWSKRWVPVTSNWCPDYLSRQLLTTASTFPYSSKNSSSEHTHTLSTWLTITNTHTHTHTHTHTDSLTLTHRLSLTHTWICIKKVNMFGWGVIRALWKGRSGVRIYLLRWSGHLFEVR